MSFLPSHLKRSVIDNSCPRLRIGGGGDILDSPMFRLCAPINNLHSEILLGLRGDLLELSGIPTFYSR